MRHWLVDAFADAPFRGNPACVVEPFDEWPSDGWLQAMAGEMAQPMTAYLKRSPQPHRFDLRWFTPRRELSFCGHATLACSHVLLSGPLHAAASIAFDAKSGPISVARVGDEYEISFPADPPRRISEPEGLAAALGAAPLEVWAGRHIIAMLAEAKDVRDLKPDPTRLIKIVGADFGPGHVTVAAPDDSGSADLVMRCFIPEGEDLATGSAVCIVAPLMAGTSGKTTLRVHQIPPGRGARLAARIDGDRVAIRGSAVTVSEGRWLISTGSGPDPSRDI